ncbi:YkgJ family cysteine cluster protein [Congregibacter litoralis]|uniref:Flagellin N-methylase n=1 Tax=Congregibacter litoralis KT71 TaxID=314285 RepID=A4A364_9GAMM|nr:YkgJ family cysteine cluster protein [Congregibacter litoralis]EAQ99137.1 Flagellin N-methylase [Congregibacter litoralis KT71]
MNCRKGCGACCIAPSITSPLPGMPEGKPANTPCVNLDMSTYSCGIWGSSRYPAVCEQFTAQEDVCGDSRQDALKLIGDMERDTV